MVKPVNHVPGDESENTDILINVLLDRSGSMSGRESDVMGHFNKFIKDQKAIPGKARVSLVIFDTEYEEVYIGKDIKSVPRLDNKVYYARGGTALLDALGKLIQSVDAIKDKPAKVLFVINTDGFENSSVEFKRSQIKALIEERQNNHDWQFLFIGAGVDAFTENTGAGLGLRSFQTWTSGGSAAGLSNSALYANSYTTAYRTTGATGQSLGDAAIAMAAPAMVVDTEAPDTLGYSVDNNIAATNVLPKKQKKVRTPK